MAKKIKKLPFECPICHKELINEYGMAPCCQHVVYRYVHSSRGVTNVFDYARPDFDAKYSAAAQVSQEYYQLLAEIEVMKAELKQKEKEKRAALKREMEEKGLKMPKKRDFDEEEDDSKPVVIEYPNESSKYPYYENIAAKLIRGTKLYSYRSGDAAGSVPLELSLCLVKKRVPKRYIFSLLAVASLVLSFPVMAVIRFVEHSQLSQEAIFYTVTSVASGNTLVLDNGNRVRLISIDSPQSGDNPKPSKASARSGQEVQPMTAIGKEAAAFTKKLVEGKKIQLEFDMQRRDNDKNLWAYVYVLGCSYNKKTQDYEFSDELSKTLFLNAAIINAGYAKVVTVAPNVKYTNLFLRLQKEAKEQKRGVWR